MNTLTFIRHQPLLKQPDTNQGALISIACTQSTRRQHWLLVIVLVMLLPLGLQAGVIFTNLVTFSCTNGFGPGGRLMVADDGSMYGTTVNGGSVSPEGWCIGGGAIFHLTTSGTVTVVAPFLAGLGNTPNAGVIKGRNGNFYGTTEWGVYGGPYFGGQGYGTVFQLSSNNLLSTLHEFDGTNGCSPDTGLVQGDNGDFYGTTSSGGIEFDGSFYSGHGTVFKITQNGVFTPVHKFDSTNGHLPYCLSAARDGNLYGTTAGGGSYADQSHDSGFGTVFRISTNDTFTSLFSFSGTNGYSPGVLLACGLDGSVYGTTAEGGSGYISSGGGYGTVFRLTPAGELSTLYEFTGGTDGAGAWGGLVRGSDDCFYGMTIVGGTNGFGTFFRITSKGVLTTLHAFTGDDWLGSITQGKDGRFYIVSSYSPASWYGNIYRLSVPMPPVFESVEKSGAALNLTWSSVAEQSYQLQYISELSSTNWTDLGSTVIATNGTMTVSDPVGADSQRFYRVVLLP